MQRRRFLIENEKYVELIKIAFDQSSQIIKKTKKVTNNFVDKEIKLSLDNELDLFFRSFFEKHTSIPVYSEESLGENSPLKGRCWIVDPLDGSLNFFRGIPFYASSIALWENGQPVLGGVYDYIHDELYLGEVATKEMSMNGETIKVEHSISPSDIKATGIPSHSNENDSIEMFRSSLANYKKLRWLGCASLSLAYVAMGRVDAYEEKGIKLWDVAGSLAIVLAAGCRAQWSFNSDGSLNVFAENKVCEI